LAGQSDGVHRNRGVSRPGNDERRPGRGGVAVEQLNIHPEATAPDGQSASTRHLHAERGPRHPSWCTGFPSVRPLLRRIDVPAIWDRQRKAWAVPTTRLDDVLVAAEHIDSRFVTVAEVAA